MINIMLKKTIVYISALLLVLLVLFQISKVDSYQDAFTWLETSELSYDQQSLLVKIKDIQSTELAKKLTNSIDHIAFPLDFITDIKSLTTHIDLQQANWYVIGINQSVTLSKAAESLLKQPQVLAVEANLYHESTMSFNDPSVSQQWYLDAINMKSAWDDLTKMGYNSPQPIIVAVIDTGIDINHPDIRNNLWVNPNESFNGQDSDGNGYVDDVYGINTVSINQPITDNVGHGTHVAGIIAATANNNIGIVGVAYQVKIMAIKAADQEGLLPSSAVIEGVNYALAYGASVINMSFGSDVNVSALYDVLLAASYRVTLVSAAGNAGLSNRIAGNGLLYPAAYPFVLGVMAMQANSRDDGSIKASFSNWDYDPNDVQSYEIMAPGVSILSTGINNVYESRSGTSMAAPMVAAAAAMMKIKFNNESLYDQAFIFNKIVQSSPVRFSHRVVSSEYYYPTLDIKQALMISPTITNITPNRVQANQSVSVTINGAHFFPGVKVFINGVAVTNVSRLSTQTLRFNVLANQVGLLELKVENVDGTFINAVIEAFVLTSDQVVITYQSLNKGVTLSANVNNNSFNSGDSVMAGSTITINALLENNYRLYRWIVNDEVLLETSAQLIIDQVISPKSIFVETILIGDVNLDQQFTITDLVRLSRYLAGLDTLTDKSKFAADINWDNQVTITDLVLLSRTLAGLE